MDPLERLIQKARDAVRFDRYEMAISFATQALAINPESDDAKLQLARALYYDGRNEEARVIFLQLIVSQPDDGRAYDFLGDIEFFKPVAQRDLAAALSWYRQAVACDVNNAIWAYSLVRCLRRMGRPEEAQARLKQALRIRPESTLLHREGARLALETDRRFSAARHLRCLLALAPDQALTHDLVVDFALTYDFHRLAGHHLAIALRIDPNILGDVPPPPWWWRWAPSFGVGLPPSEWMYPGSLLLMNRLWPLRRPRLVSRRTHERLT